MNADQKNKSSLIMLYSLTGLILTCFSGVIFLLDILFSIYFLVALFYVFLIVVTLLICPKKWFILYMACLCSFLLLLGYDQNPGNSSWQILSSRFTALMVIWTSVGLGFVQLNVKNSNLLLEEKFKKVFHGAPNGLILINSS